VRAVRHLPGRQLRGSRLHCNQVRTAAPAAIGKREHRCAMIQAWVFFRPRQCLPCDGTTSFSNKANAPACTQVSQCEIGSFLAAAATATSDLNCTLCPAGTTDADRDVDTACEPCPAGTFCPRGSAGPFGAAPLACPPGFADLDNDPKTPCEACFSKSQFQPNAMQTSCQTPEPCGPGLYLIASFTSTSPNVCAGCIPGTFKDVAGNTPCVEVKHCGPGFEPAVSPNATTDRVCRACQVLPLPLPHTLPG
jgi:hypothetical protein